MALIKCKEFTISRINRHDISSYVREAIQDELEENLYFVGSMNSLDFVSSETDEYYRTKDELWLLFEHVPSEERFINYIVRTIEREQSSLGLCYRIEEVLEELPNSKFVDCIEYSIQDCEGEWSLYCLLIFAQESRNLYKEWMDEEV
jgi:hypothetical protein